MSHQPHHPHRHLVAGFFAHRDDAHSTLETLLELGLPRERLHLFHTSRPAADPAPLQDNNAVLKDMIVDGAIGSAIGTGLGGLAGVALAAANVSLYIASPLLAPLMLLGWGASLGATLGATVGAVASPSADAAQRSGWLSDLVRDAIASGQTVLVVDARTRHDTSTAREVIRTAVGDHKEVSLV